ncbi:MAG: helicase-related protein [Bacteroidota bacterium]
MSKLDLTSNPRIDAGWLESKGFDGFHLLRPPQPLWIMEKILDQLSKEPKAITPRIFMKRAMLLLKEFSPRIRFGCDSFSVTDLTRDRFDSPQIESSFFRGRSLLLTEIPDLLRSSGLNLPWDAEEWMQYFYCQGKIKREAAVSYDRIGLAYCRRCGSTRQINEDNCTFCGNARCLTCLNCQSMGLAKSCIPLYSAPNPERLELGKVIEPVLNFQLTPPQLRASQGLEHFWEQGEREYLVWAVCGAGKTEVSFGIIAKALSEGARVLIAIPRKDVVQELLPRFEKAFPEISVTVLYGGSGNRTVETPLTIATTHQCLRFYQNFDLIILDEGDAYPYQGSAMLHFAVRRSLKPEGKMVIMTATPDQVLIAEIDSGRMPFVTIPARPHRKPLIAPELIKLDLHFPTVPGSKWEPPPLVKQFLIDIKANKRKALIFLPTIKLIEAVGKGLIQWAQTQGISGALIHSKAGNRDKIKAEFREGTLDFLVASTVLERGITIPNLEVLVLLADNEMVFDSRTLVQIAGRVGRIGEPARVLFTAARITKAMRDSYQWIVRMNEEGYRLGYLDQE